MSRRNLGWLLGFTAVALFGLAVASSAPVRDRDRDYEHAKLLIDVLHEVRHKYVQDLDPERERRLVEDMINGGLERLDPHSAYINAKEFKQFSKQSKGRFGGIGIQIALDRGQLKVISPMVGTPAYEAGVLAGDFILKIDGKSTENMRLTEAVDLIQGEPGEKITLTVLHEAAKEPVDVNITRAVIHVPSVLGDLRKPDNPNEWDYLIDKDSKIAYIRLANFSESAAEEMREAVAQIEKEGARGLILDLRNNPGGLLSAAEKIADLFLTDGVIVSTRGRNEKERVYEARSEGTLLTPAAKYPMVVLINRYSASASEIVAAALQDHKRAIIIGERSYGKGSVQNILAVENGTAALKLTTASYWRPSGKNIHRFPDAKDTDEWGVRPNDSGYLLTARSIQSLRADAVLDRLKPLVGTRYGTEKEYLDELGKVLSSEDMSLYRSKLLDRADRGFEVPLKDEELASYLLYRRDRDIVHGKPGSPSPQPPKPAKESDTEARGNKPPGPRSEKEAEADKKPFEDRVLQKALDYLRGELKRVGAASPLFETVHG